MKCPSIELIKAALPMLNSARLLGDLLLFFKLVGRSQFPLSNISLLLFLDVMRFYGCSILMPPKCFALR